MSKTYDRLLWLGLAVFAVVAAKGISNGLHEIVRLTEVHHPERHVSSAPEKKSAAAADSIHITSLVTLAKGSNVEIARAATALMCDRFIRNDVAMDQLAIHLLSTNAQTRRRAQKVRNMLEEFLGESGQSIWSRSHKEDLDVHGHMAMPVPPSARSRHHEESPEEQALRRRRREAMVFNEGDRPISQDDIIQRGSTLTEAEASAAELALETITMGG